MRVAVIFVAVIVMTAPAPASAGCMSIGEARHQFGSVHLYWHGASHCWDASPGRRRYAAQAERHAGGQKRSELQRRTWREARSELVVDNEPARAAVGTADQADTAPDTSAKMMPVKVTPIKLASFVADWSERWVDVEQIIPDHRIKAQSNLLAPPAPEHAVDVSFVVRGLALFTFGFGLILTFAALSMRSGRSAIGPPAMVDAPYAIGGFAAGQDDGLISHGAYPTEVTWPDSAGAMISRNDMMRPFSVPSRLLEEARQAASRALTPRTPPTPHTG
jgi:hypothetical protein